MRRLFAGILVLIVVVTGAVAVYLDEPVIQPVTNVALSAALVWFTAELVREGRLARESRIAPALAVFLRPSSEGRYLMELVVQNYGGGPAHTITLAVDHDLVTRKGASLRSTHVVEHGLAYLPPKGEYATVIGDSEFLKANADGASVPSVRVATRCLSVSGRVYEHESWLDLSPRATATPAAVRAAASLESIAKKMT